MAITQIIPLLLIASVSLAESSDLAIVQENVDAGWYEAANTMLDPLVNSKSADPQAYYLKAKVLLFLRELDEAQDWAEKSVKAAPDSSRYWSQLGTIKAFRIRKSPMKGVTLGRSTKKNYEKGVEIDPTNLEALWSLLRFNMYAPGIAGGNKDKARQMAEEILAVDRAQGHLARAEILRRLDDDLEKSRMELAKATAVDPTNANLCYEIGRSLMAEGNPQVALEYYQLGAERDPIPAAGQVRLGKIFLRLGMYPEAEGAFQNAQSDPEQVLPAEIGVGHILAATGQPEKSLAKFRQLAQAHPDYLPLNYHLAQSILANGGPSEEARDLLQSYLESSLNYFWPSRAQGNWQLALALEDLGEFNLAYEAITYAMENGPEVEAMKRDAKRMEFMAID